MPQHRPISRPPPTYSSWSRSARSVRVLSSIPLISSGTIVAPEFGLVEDGWVRSAFDTLSVSRLQPLLTEVRGRRGAWNGRHCGVHGPQADADGSDVVSSPMAN